MSNAYGSVTWWGFSPARNFQEELSKYGNECDDSKEINILLIGAGDGRHIFKTLSKFRDSSKKINFYIVENSLETLARQILLITLALEPCDEMSLQEKSELFLDIFGNSLIRTQTDEYISKQCNKFIKWVTNSDQVENRMLNFSNLKFKERDGLESIFKFWRNKDPSIFDMRYYWDDRVRHHLGVRYDSKYGAFDWDYSMKLREKASVINWLEYKYWREHGVAFRIRDDSSYEIPNKTLASGLMFSINGERVSKWGYWGDILISPYISYGIECHEKALMETRNNVHTKTSSDISLFNIVSTMYELQTGRKYEYKEDKCSIEEVNESEDEKVGEEEFQLSNIMIHLLPLNSIPDLHRKSKFKSKFDLIFFSNSMVHYLGNAVCPLFNKDGLLIVESTRFMFDLKDELHKDYGEKIGGMALNAGCSEAKKFDPERDFFAYFKFDNQ